MNLKPAVSEKDHIKGNKDATLEIVEYGDFQCPHCAIAHVVTQEMMDEFGSYIKFVFRNFPLSQIHSQARAAAQAAEAAGLQGKYWEMHNSIFEDQSHINNNDLKLRAETLGLDIPQFSTDMQKSSIANKIDSDFESGARSGVNGTPSFFVNGKKFNGSALDLFKEVRESVG